MPPAPRPPIWHLGSANQTLPWEIRARTKTISSASRGHLVAGSRRRADMRYNRESWPKNGEKKEKEKLRERRRALGLTAVPESSSSGVGPEFSPLGFVKYRHLLPTRPSFCWSKQLPLAAKWAPARAAPIDHQGWRSRARRGLF